MVHRWLIGFATPEKKFKYVIKPFLKQCQQRLKGQEQIELILWIEQQYKIEIGKDIFPPGAIGKYFDYLNVNNDSISSSFSVLMI